MSTWKNRFSRGRGSWKSWEWGRDSGDHEALTPTDGTPVWQLLGTYCCCVGFRPWTANPLARVVPWSLPYFGDVAWGPQLSSRRASGLGISAESAVSVRISGANLLAAALLSPGLGPAALKFAFWASFLKTPGLLVLEHKSFGPRSKETALSVSGV